MQIIRLYRLTALIATTIAASAAVFTNPAMASRPVCMQATGTVHLEVVDRERGTLPVYSGRGERFIEGLNGNRYEVLVCNPTPQRVLAVVSVDGVNVVSGETANYGQGGYVVSPYGELVISGWRHSLKEVKAFYFTNVGDSYAGRTGRPANTGVIGAAFFREVSPPAPILIEPQGRLRTERDANRAEAGGTAPATPSAPASVAKESSQTDASVIRPSPRPVDKLGTGYGESLASAVRTTTFERESAPFSVATVRYESRQRLSELGVLPPASPRVRPDAFPGQFVPEPPPRS